VDRMLLALSDGGRGYSVSGVEGWKYLPLPVRKILPQTGQCILVFARSRPSETWLAETNRLFTIAAQYSLMTDHVPLQLVLENGELLADHIASERDQPRCAVAESTK